MFWYRICCSRKPEDFITIRRIKENNMAEENGAGNNFIWAITTIIIVAIIAGALYYGGILSGKQEKDIDIKVDVPASKPN